VSNGAAGVNGDVGGARADVHQRDAQFFLVLGEHRVTGRHRVEHQVVHFQSTTANALHDVLGSALRAGDDVDLGLQAQSTHADRLFDLLTIDHKLLGF